MLTKYVALSSEHLETLPECHLIQSTASSGASSGEAAPLLAIPAHSPSEQQGSHQPEPAGL